MRAGHLNVLGIGGSLRRGSFNRQLLHAAAACAPAGVGIRVCDGLAAIPLFDEDIEQEARAAGPVADLRRMVTAADGLLFSTPEYNQSIPGVLKNVIDWLSRDDSLVDKPVAVIGATAGRWGTRLAQSTLRHVLYATESRVMPAPTLFLAEADRAFDFNGRLIDKQSTVRLGEVLTAFAAWIDMSVSSSTVQPPAAVVR
jgi:chromate reductase, NAD(P)H dehydrogenase (quinone)